MSELEANIVQVLLTQAQIQTRVQELGAQLAADYADKNPLFVCLLKGSSIFFADLVRAVPIPLELDFMRVSSYGDGTVTSGQVRFEVPLSQSLTGRHVVLVEDILDTGTTLHAVLPVLETQNPASMAVCALLDKPERRLFEVPLAYGGFSIPDAFVVGYGLDYAGLYRNLPYIGIYGNSDEQQKH
ncbi:MAG: hypoxanthine phosphoribosyltransferase [Ruminococcus sp.]